MNYVEQMQNNQFSMEAFLARKFTQKYIPPSERKKNEAKVLPTRAEVAKFTGKPQEEEENFEFKEKTEEEEKERKSSSKQEEEEEKEDEEKTSTSKKGRKRVEEPEPDEELDPLMCHYCNRAYRSEKVVL